MLTFALLTVILQSFFTSDVLPSSELFRRLCKICELGNVARFWVGSKPYCIVSSARAVEVSENCEAHFRTFFRHVTTMSFQRMICCVIKMNREVEDSMIYQDFVQVEWLMRLRKWRVFLYPQTILSSSKHIDKSWDYTLFRPWLGEGLVTSTGKSKMERNL